MHARGFRYRTVTLVVAADRGSGNTFPKGEYFLHAHTMRTFGVVFVEAMLAGLPVVATKPGALPDMGMTEQTVF